MNFYKYLCLSLFVGGGICSPANAQVIIDGTTNTSLETTNNQITVNNGDRAGNNLFHSFSEFSIPNGGAVNFNNAVEIENIFSRVTGSNISDINGAISANGTANLLLINPAGIIFGENATLNLGGSFLATTAESLLFEQGEFSAVDPQAAPLLTINRPIGLNFGNSPGEIINRANSGQSRTETFTNGDRVEDVTINSPIGLQVSPGQDLTLIGGDITLDGGGLTAPGGRVELGGLSTAGEVTIEDNGSLSFPDGVTKADISLSNDAEVNVSAGGGGAINVNANNLVLSEGSELYAGIAENTDSVDAQAGDITISADESVRLIGNEIDVEGLDTVISNHVGLSAIKREDPKASSTAVGNGGSIFINSDRLELSGRSIISTITFGQGNAGKVVVEADSVEINSLAEITSRVRQSAIGNSNNVELNVNSLNINNGFVVSDVGDFGIENPELAIGNSGDVIINAANVITLNASEGFSIVLSQIQDNAVGNAGDITINTGTLSLGKDSFILANNSGEGNSGNINLNATESVRLDGFGSLILTQVSDGVAGDGGDINITAPTIFVTNFSKIAASAREGSQGQAGDITLNAEDSIILTEGSVVDTLSENDFDSGDINLNASNLELSNGGKIVTANDRGGNAGNINLNITEYIKIANGNPPIDTFFPEMILIDLEQATGIFANNSANSTGSGGSIQVTAKSLEFSDRGTISASTFSGGGGNIELQVEDVISLRNNSLISAEASGVGNGGNVNIDTELIIALGNDGNGNDIVAKAAEAGTGGNIEISTNAIVGLQARTAIPFNNTNDIDASSEFGLDGSVTINNPDVDPTAGIVELPTVPIDAEAILAQDLCKVENEDIAGGSSFIVTGKGGLTPTSAESLDNRDRVVNWTDETVDLEDGMVVSVSVQPKRKTVVQSQGMTVAADGSVWLTANGNDATPQGSVVHPDCQT